VIQQKAKAEPGDIGARQPDLSSQFIELFAPRGRDSQIDSRSLAMAGNFRQRPAWPQRTARTAEAPSIGRQDIAPPSGPIRLGDHR
jgi:hypothetical protein